MPESAGAPDYVIPDDVPPVVVRLLNGWEPRAPELAAPTRFAWSGREFSTEGRRVHVDGDKLELKAIDFDPFWTSAERNALNNKPLEGELADGSRFAADYGFSYVDRVTGRYWTVTRPGRRTRLWIARLNGLESLDAFGNLSVGHSATRPDGSTSYSGNHPNHLFRGAYDYYLVQRLVEPSPVTWFLVLDAIGTDSPTRERVYPDMLALQFVLGRAFWFDVLHAVDEAGEVIAMVGGQHGRDHGARPRTQPPVPLELSPVHWSSAFFTLISAAYREHPERRFYVPRARGRSRW